MLSFDEKKLLEKAKELILQREFDESHALVERVLAQNPKSIEALRLRGCNLGKPELVIRDLKYVIDNADSKLMADYFFIGKALYICNYFDKAVWAFETALAQTELLDYEYYRSGIQSQLCLSYAYAGRVDEAQRLFDSLPECAMFDADGAGWWDKPTIQQFLDELRSESR